MKILLVVDMQHDFIDGSLGSTEAQAIVPRVVDKIKECAADPNYAIVYTRDTHFDNYLHTREGNYLPVEHGIRETGGWTIPTDIYNASEGAHWREIIDKFTFGGYNLPEMFDTIDSECIKFSNPNIESIEIIGLCTDICVISNALILKSQYYETTPIIVYADCCAGVTPAKHEAALEVMRSCQIDVI